MNNKNELSKVKTGFILFIMKVTGINLFVLEILWPLLSYYILSSSTIIYGSSPTFTPHHGFSCL